MALRFTRRSDRSTFLFDQLSAHLRDVVIVLPFGEYEVEALTSESWRGTAALSVKRGQGSCARSSIELVPCAGVSYPQRVP